MKSSTCRTRRFAVTTFFIALLFALVGSACIGGLNAAPPTDGVGDSDPSNAGENGVSDPGISDDHILFGQSAVFSGPSQELGREMRRGIEAAFREVNEAGGIYGRELRLKTLDDSYETDYAVHTTTWLIDKARVFALIGAVGTPTSRVALPIANAAGIPFVAPLTGAEFLRDPGLDNVINLRASYYQETEEIVAYLTEVLGLTRVAVLYQDDSFGQNGLDGTRMALAARGLEPIGSWTYRRNTSAMKRASSSIVEANPEAVVMIGAHEPVAATVELVGGEIDPVFATVSFGGGNALSQALGDNGDGVYVTQVVPFPDHTSLPVVSQYRAALLSVDPKATPGFVSFEGYLAGRLAIFGVSACGLDLNRECFVHAVRTAGVIDMDGFLLSYGPADNQGSDAVFISMIGPDGKYHQVDNLNGRR